MIPSPCGEPPPALIAQVPAGRTAGTQADPARDSDGNVGDPLIIVADRVEADLGGDIIRARGNVQATFRHYRLRADDLWFDALGQRGRASGGIRLGVSGYHLEASEVEFDIANEQALSGPWQGIAEGRGRLQGEFLFLSPIYAYASGAIYSPCLADDPGYFLASDRFEWFPYGGKDHYEGSNVVVHLSGAPVARVPSLRTALEPREQEEEQRGGRAVDTKVGYNAYDGAFANGTGTFSLAEGHEGTVPVKVTQSRGFLLGTAHTYSRAQWTLAGDASYQTRYQGGTSGPRANLTATTALPAGPTFAVGAGYRTDLSGQAVHRLPELLLTSPGVPLGPLSLSTGTKAAYYAEAAIDPSGPPPDPNNPLSQPAERTGFGGVTYGHWAGLAPPAWQPNAFWESQPYLKGSLFSYLGRAEDGNWSRNPSNQAVAAAGIRNIQHWRPWLETQLGVEVNRTAGVSPFLHDRVYPADLLSGGVTIHPDPRWSLSLGTLYSRAPEQVAFQRADLQLRLGYRGPCLSWSLSLQVLSLEPFSPAFSFDYQIGTP